MTDRRINWALLVRADADPLSLAREWLLSGRAELDEDGERFLATLVNDMDPWDLLAWLARRGPSPHEVPGGVPSNKSLVARIAEQLREVQSPADPFIVSGEPGEETLWGVAITAIEPEAWDDLVESMLPSQREPRLRMRAVATLHGCDDFAKLCALGVSTRIPFEVRLREPEPSARLRIGEICERLLPHRRDPRELARRLHQRARDAAAEGDLVPLWLLDALGLLGPATDPAALLPTRVRFSCEREEEVPYALYPVALALRWPSDQAKPWVRDQVLAALRRGADPYHMGTTLQGKLAARRGHFAWEERELTPLLATWLSDRSAFDDLMRASVDEAAPLPLAWVTVARDLVARRDDAWARALRWLDASPPEVLVDDGVERLLRAATYDTTAWPDLAELAVDPLGATRRPAIQMMEPRDVDELAVDGPLRARQWILLHAPLPPAVDEALAGRLDDLLGSLDDLLCRRPAERGARLPSAADEGRLRATLWCRYAELPSTPSRRARLVGMLHEDPALLACGDERVVDHLGALDERELPREERRWLRFHTEDADIWRARYLRLGGLPAARRALAAIDLEHLDLSPATLAATATLVRAQHATLVLDVLERRGLRRGELVDVACAHLAARRSSAVASWIGARLTSNTAWSEDGVRLVEALADRHGGCVWEVCEAAWRAGSERRSLLDAMLMACAEVLGARARGAMQRGDHRGARRALRALMELDAPSRAYRFVGPLRKMAKGDEGLDVLVEACEHLLRRDDGRASSLGGIGRALERFSAGEE